MIGLTGIWPTLGMGRVDRRVRAPLIRIVLSVAQAPGRWLDSSCAAMVYRTLGQTDGASFGNVTARSSNPTRREPRPDATARPRIATVSALCSAAWLRRGVRGLREPR